MNIDSSIIDLNYIVGPYVFDIEEKASLELVHECMKESSASNSEEQQKAASQYSKEARAEVELLGQEAKLKLYFLTIQKDLEDYAELLIDNAYVTAKYIFREAIQDAISQSDSQERLMELVGPQLKEQISNMLQSMFGGA